MKKRLNDRQKIEIVEKYKTGQYNCADLGREYHVSRHAINSLLKRRGLKVNNNLSHIGQKYTLNENYFNSIDTEEKAYFLGLLYADGYNGENRNRVTISLQESDYIILEKFSNAISSNRQIKFIVKNEINSKLKNIFCIEIVNKQLSLDLAKLGCFQCKSLTLKFPTEEQVPSHLIRHFIRGYFDGDGCLYFTHKNTKARCGIISTNDFCLQLKNYLLKYLPNIKINVRHDKRVLNKETRELRISCHQDSIDFLDWLYSNSTIYLHRKYEKYLSIERNL